MCSDAILRNELQDRLGTVFNINDDFTSGLLGVLCVGVSPFDAFNELCDVLDFVSSEHGDSKQVGNHDDRGTSGARYSGRGDFSAIRATVRYLAERLRGGQ